MTNTTTNNDKRDLHIALVGCGGWGKNILRDLIDLGCQTSVVARSEASVERAKNASRIVSSIDRLEEVDAFIVATPLGTHYEVVNQILELFPDKPIFCEKALCNRKSQAEDLARRAPRHLFVMDKWRYQKGILELKKIYESKELGEVIGMDITRSSSLNHHPDVDMLWTLLPHDLSIALEIFGEIPEVKAVIGDSNKNGSFGIKAILGERPWIHFSCSARAFERDREFTLYFEKGLARTRPQIAHDKIEIFRQDDPFNLSAPKIEVRTFPDSMPLRDELEAFLEFVEGTGPEPKSSADEAYQIVKSICQIRLLAGFSEDGAPIKD